MKREVIVSFALVMLFLLLESPMTTFSAVSTPLSVSVTPHYAAMFGGQSQLFNSTVTGGSPPYTYQWFLDMNAVSGAINPTWNTTAPPFHLYSTSPDTHFVSVLVTDSVATQHSDGASVWEPASDAPVYYSVEPVPVTPLTNVNASINELDTPPTPSSIGENFTVEIHLRNATAMNAPYGVEGVEVHFYFGNILDYCKPVGFTDELGQTGSALVGPVLYGIAAGFYDDQGANSATPATSPYTNTTQYIVSAASLSSLAGPWNFDDGLVAKIAFQITAQPSQRMSQPDFYAPLQIVYGEVANGHAVDIPVSVAQGILRIDGTHLLSAVSLVGDVNGDGKANLQDLTLLANAYGSHVGDPNWNGNADFAAPWSVIDSADLVALTLNYGQHKP